VAVQTERPPYEAYAAIAGAFVAGLGGDVQGVRGRSPASGSRASFVNRSSKRGRALGRRKHPAGLGELVTCTRCIGMWNAAVLVSTQMLTPRFARALT
jgi:hypothetical protein